MLLLRVLFGIPLLVAIGCAVAFVLTRDSRWLRRGLFWAGGAVVAAVLFLGTLFLEGNV